MGHSLLRMPGRGLRRPGCVFSDRPAWKRGFSLTSEQLEASRAERMRLDGHGTLTLEDARTWIEETGLCLFRSACLEARFFFDIGTIGSIARRKDAPGRTWDTHS